MSGQTEMILDAPRGGIGGWWRDEGKKKQVVGDLQHMRRFYGE
jgi:hypothetical protein